MRNKKKFSEIGNILQSKVVQPNETAEIFNLEMPKNYIGFLYYMANDYFPMKLNIDGEEVEINGIIAPIGSPQLYDPPYIVKNFIKVSAINTTKESRTISFYTYGIAYSILTLSEETLVSEIGGKMGETIRTQERPPKTADILNHNLNEANRWYEIKLPKELITWQIRCRSNQDILYSYSPTHTTYFTLRSGEVLSADTSPNRTLNAVWVMCETAGIIIELEFWKR